MRRAEILPERLPHGRNRSASVPAATNNWLNGVSLPVAAASNGTAVSTGAAERFSGRST
jgi:hypothetical protein